MMFSILLIKTEKTVLLQKKHEKKYTYEFKSLYTFRKVVLALKFNCILVDCPKSIKC